jgi:hypothetical protein
MLDLDSPLWATIPASCGGSSALTVKLLREAYVGDDSGFPELLHQVCHQFTVGANAYVAGPHLVAIARQSELKRRVWPLSIIGSVEAARLTHPKYAPPLSAEWRPDYLAAIVEAMQLTADALRVRTWEPSESQELFAALAAFQGHSNLAMHLFLHGGNTRLSCPLCGEYIEWGDDAES